MKMVSYYSSCRSNVMFYTKMGNHRTLSNQQEQVCQLLFQELQTNLS